MNARAAPLVAVLVASSCASHRIHPDAVASCPGGSDRFELPQPDAIATTISAIHRAALKSEAARHTALTNLFTGRPARGIMNYLMRELGPINGGAPAFPLATSAIAPLRAKAEAKGLGDFSPLWSGQNATGCKEVPAAHLTRELAAGL
jgi:hypothetical protein